MPQYYNPKEKARAIQKLYENLGNTWRTSEQTGIPERTLQRWKTDLSPDTVLMADDFLESMELVVRQKYIRIRNKLIDIVELYSDKILENPDDAANYILDYSRALRQLVAAEQLASVRSFTLVILWEDQEGFLRLSPEDVFFAE